VEAELRNASQALDYSQCLLSVDKA